MNNPSVRIIWQRLFRCSLWQQDIILVLRGVFIWKSYRYNLDLAPKAMLIEAGAQTNTVEEMRNAMEVLADVLSRVLTP